MPIKILQGNNGVIIEVGFLEVGQFNHGKLLYLISRKINGFEVWEYTIVREESCIVEEVSGQIETDQISKFVERIGVPQRIEGKIDFSKMGVFPNLLVHLLEALIGRGQLGIGVGGAVHD